MATTTTNYGLSKPALIDYYDITVFNDDMDAIDTALYSIATDLTTVSETVITQETISSELLEAVATNTEAIEELQSTDVSLQEQITQNAANIIALDASDIAAASYEITTENDEQIYSFDTVTEFIIYTLETLQTLGLSVDDEGYIVQETGD